MTVNFKIYLALNTGQIFWPHWVTTRVGLSADSLWCLTLSAVALDKTASSTVELYSSEHSRSGADFTAIARAKLRPWRTIQSTPDTSAADKQITWEDSGLDWSAFLDASHPKALAGPRCVWSYRGHAAVTHSWAPLLTGRHTARQHSLQRPFSWHPTHTQTERGKATMTHSHNHILC